MTLHRLVVGLGNPGEVYAGTRHNIGFEVTARIIKDLGLRPSRFRGGFGAAKSLGEIAQSTERGFALLEPTTFMNLSGSAVALARDRFELDPASILVVCDDFHLALARVRVRPGGSAGGHNGLKSIIGSLATDQFPRVRLGIGEVRGETEKFVLSRFNVAERQTFVPVIEMVAMEIGRWCLDGNLNRLMTSLNAPTSEAQKSDDTIPGLDPRKGLKPKD